MQGYLGKWGLRGGGIHTCIDVVVFSKLVGSYPTYSVLLPVTETTFDATGLILPLASKFLLTYFALV